MRVLADLHTGERWLTRRTASWDNPWVRRVLPTVEEAAEHTKLWCAVAAVMAGAGGVRGRQAAAAGLASMAVAETIANGGVKRVWQRRRPPGQWFRPEDVAERPDSPSFPSGHTAAAVAFTAAIAPIRPWAGVACAVPTVVVAVERVHRGAHYPSDVAVGAAIGLAAAGLVRAAPGLLRRL
jgi:membrane-associated phospholipid phosphatase